MRNSCGEDIESGITRPGFEPLSAISILGDLEQVSFPESHHIVKMTLQLHGRLFLTTGVQQNLSVTDNALRTHQKSRLSGRPWGNSAAFLTVPTRYKDSSRTRNMVDTSL